MEYCGFLDCSVNGSFTSTPLIPFWFVLLTFHPYLGSELQQRAGTLSRGRNVLPPGDPRGVLITSVTNQGDNFSSISAF